jgi:hypothetical protein
MSDWFGGDDVPWLAFLLLVLICYAVAGGWGIVLGAVLGLPLLVGMLSGLRR